MKKLFKGILTLSVLFVIPMTGLAQTASKSSTLRDVLGMIKSKSYVRAASTLYSLSVKPEYQSEKYQIKYLLGSVLLELKLYQVATFQFIDIVRQGDNQYFQGALEKLSVAADALGDETLLNYAIGKVDLNRFPENKKEIIYYRLAQIKMSNEEYDQAIDLFSKVPFKSRYGFQAQYQRGLAYLQSNRAPEALKIYSKLYKTRTNASVIDDNRVASMMAIARTQYQMQDFDKAVNTYRQIPRDHILWHDSVFESSWALLRSAKFRSVLSNFQTLHSAYYEDTYNPEALILRATVYLYICKYDEMEKVLQLFEKVYGPVARSLKAIVNSTQDDSFYFQEVYRLSKSVDYKNLNLKIPLGVARYTMNQGDVKSSLVYIQKLNDERKRLERAFPSRGGLYTYAQKILQQRVKNAQSQTGAKIKTHLAQVRSEIKDYYDQAGFVRYEMVSGQREQTKKRLDGKKIVDQQQVDDKVDRTYYIQNGYEYWPFQGEYWLDEIGNYHYLGKQACE